MKEITIAGNRIADKVNNVGVNLIPEFVAFGAELRAETDRTNLSLNKLFPELVADGLKLGKSMTYLASQSSVEFEALGYLPHVSVFRLHEFLPLYRKLPKNTSQRDKVRFWRLASDMTITAKALAERFGIVPSSKVSDASEKPVGEMPDDRIAKIVREIIRTDKLPVLLAALIDHIDGDALISAIAADTTARREAARIESENQQAAAMSYAI